MSTIRAPAWTKVLSTRRPRRGYYPCTGMDEGDGVRRHTIVTHKRWVVPCVLCTGIYCDNDACLLVLDVASSIERNHFVHGQCIRQDNTTSIHRYRGASRRSPMHAPAWKEQRNKHTNFAPAETCGEAYIIGILIA